MDGILEGRGAANGQKRTFVGVSQRLKIGMSAFDSALQWGFLYEPPNNGLHPLRLIRVGQSAVAGTQVVDYMFRV